ncbi:TPA: hypothetical protein H2C15_004455 [Salmonella enterica]|nr:hypothetical protein [Salmonella enterica]
MKTVPFLCLLNRFFVITDTSWIDQNQQRHDADKTQITNQSNDIKNQNSELEKQYNLEKNKHEKMYNEKMESQGHIPGGYSKEELTKMAEDMQKKHRGGKGDS